MKPTTDELRQIAREQNARDGLGPITDPALLWRVAVALMAWRQRRKEGARDDP